MATRSWGTGVIAGRASRRLARLDWRLAAAAGVLGGVGSTLAVVLPGASAGWIVAWLAGTAALAGLAYRADPLVQEPAAPGGRRPGRSG